MKVFWNDGSPKAANIKGSGNNQVLVNIDGTTSMGGLRDIVDLYEVVEVGGKPSQYQVDGGDTWEKNGDVVTKTKTLSFKPVADIQSIKIEASTKTKGSMLAKSDWEVIAEMDSARNPGKPRAMPQATKDKRLAIITAHDDFETAVVAETDPAVLVDMQPDFPIDEVV